MMTLNKLLSELSLFLENINDTEKKIEVLNTLKHTLHKLSPFINEPVDCVLWVKASDLKPNDFNPNVMAPPEKKLLLRSLENNGYTQPIVVIAQPKNHLIIDGFHRYSLGMSKSSLRKRLNNYLPITLANERCDTPAKCIAATIRHNRARGKHQIAAMSAIVQDLCRLGWTDDTISNELGMDADEVLRLKQINGLTELFQGNTYNEGWTVK